MLKLTAMIPILMILFSCSAKVSVHVPLVIPEQCIFSKFTHNEKIDMGLSGRNRVFNNQQDCRDRQQRINAIISAHNQLHTN